MRTRKTVPFAVLLCAGLVLGAARLGAQEPPEASAEKAAKDPYRPRLLGLPFIYYSPETKLAFGAGGVLNFRAGRRKETIRPSTIWAYASYNLARQFNVYLKPEIYTKSNGLIFTGRFRYERTPQLFYGIGDNTDAAAGESYTPRIFTLQFGVKRRILSGLFGGLEFEFERVTMETVVAGGLLASGTVTGSHGGLIAGFGADLDWDTRDSVLFPLRGALLQLAAHAYGITAGSDFSFNRVELNLRKYMPTGLRSAVALQAYVCSTGGEVPFYKLALLGGDSLLRGYYRGRFRDKGLIVVQGEYRTLVTKRIGVAGFAGLGDVFPGLEGLGRGRLKFSVGSGLRYVINKRDGTTVRLDMAWGKESFGLYITAQEAF
jgi:outer membrane protein assembly factor BamA